MSVPAHVAIVMDGNGRWALRRLLSRTDGHKKGVEAVKKIVEAAIERGILYLTLFAFSSENWKRPKAEVNALMGLFMKAMREEMPKLKEQQVCVRIVGDRENFSADLKEQMSLTEEGTAGFKRLHMTLAINYGGRWDMVQAINELCREKPNLAGRFTEDDLKPYLALAGMPEPDLFIRTGGEQRISNFLLWHIAYTELYFSPVLWPDFDAACLDEALASFKNRERRFGQVEVTAPRQATVG